MFIKMVYFTSQTFLCIVEFAQPNEINQCFIISAVMSISHQIINYTCTDMEAAGPVNDFNYCLLTAPVLKLT